jgi:large subunit ribosomal protein L32e
MVDKKLLEQRNKAKTRKPTFLRQDANRNQSLEKKWIKPKGMHSKMRIKLRSRRVWPSPGYCSPNAVKGLTRKGYESVVVKNINDLAAFDAKTQVVVIGHVGLKRKVEIIKYCIEKKYNLENIKNAQEFITKIESKFAEKKKVQKEKEEKKKKAKEELSKKVEEKKEEKKEVKEEHEETKKGDKSEKIKVLEKKQ